MIFGFRKTDSNYVLERKLDEEFFCRIILDRDNLDAWVFESATGEKYDLLDVKSARGSFVAEIRSRVKKLVEQVVLECFLSQDLHQPYVRWLEDELEIKGDFPWEEETYSVYRCLNDKWFALIMRIKYSNLGFESHEPVWVVNLKADQKEIQKLVDRRSIFPAWHMNKKNWITVLLTSATDFKRLKELTLESKSLVERKKVNAF